MIIPILYAFKIWLIVPIFEWSFHPENVFLPFAIPGEELEINITESKKDYDNGQIVKIHRIFSTVYFYMYIIKF